MSVLIQAEYEALQSIAGRFARAAEATGETERRLRERMVRLRESWQGEGAAAFFAEMEGEVLPVTARLREALAEAQRTTHEIARTMRAAEEEAAALFKSGASLHPRDDDLTVPLAAPAQQGPSYKRLGHDRSKPRLRDLVPSLLYRNVPLEDLLSAIGRASQEDKLAILNNPAYMRWIRDRYGPAAQTVIVAALLEGSLYWPGPSGPNESGAIAPTSDFGRWMRGEGPPPDPATGSMNCWEYLMYAAYLSGDVSYEELTAIHNQAAAAARAETDPYEAYGAYYGVIEHALGADSRVSLPLGVPPPAGSIIFFDTGSGPLAHVVMATGRLAPDGSPEIVSLWTLPFVEGWRYQSVQITSVEKVSIGMRGEGWPAPIITHSPYPAWVVPGAER